MARKPITPPRTPGGAWEIGSLEWTRERIAHERAAGPVVHIPVDARKLITIGPEHPVWTGTPIQVLGEGPKHDLLLPMLDLLGAIVRLQPPANANNVESIVECVRSVAAAVKVMPAAPEDRVLLEAAPPTPESVQTIREVVYEMVTVARTANRDLLVDVVEEALCAAGL